MDLKKYHTIKITLNALILLVLIGCSANQLKNTQARQAQNNDSYNIDIGSVILSSKYSESEYKLIERMFAFRSFSEENFNELDKIIDRNDLSNKDKSTLNSLRNDLLQIKSNLNRKIAITAPNELKQTFIESVFKLPYNFELSFNDTQAVQFLRSNELFCNSLELDSLKTIAKFRSSEDKNIAVITNFLTFYLLQRESASAFLRTTGKAPLNISIVCFYRYHSDPQHQQSYQLPLTLKHDQLGKVPYHQNEISHPRNAQILEWTAKKFAQPRQRGITQGSDQ